MNQKKSVNIADILDDGEWGGIQKSVVILVALTIIFDGFDNQAIGFAIPALSKDWGIAPQDFKSVAAMGLIGMTIGTAIAGFLGDLFGRRFALIGSVFLFGFFTMTTVFATDLTSLTILRFLAGLGLGGAMPNATAMAAEFSPLRNRPMAVTLTIVCVPLGGLLGGLIAAQVLPEYGWQALFLVAGSAPLLLSVYLFFKLPESPRYLAKKPKKEASLRHLLSRMGRDIPEDVEIYDPDQEKVQSVGLRPLFAPALLRDTLGLWASFFLCLIAIYTVFSWIPATLAQAGFDQRMSSLGLAGFNFGGVAGAVGAAWAISKVGSRAVMLPLSLIGVVIAGAVAVIGIEQMSGTMLIGMLAILGLAVNGVQTTMFALAAHVYPSMVRASGVGAALAFGRIGAILSAYIGAAVLASGGGGKFFAVLAVAMAGTFLALAVVRNHVPKPMPLEAR